MKKNKIRVIICFLVIFLGSAALVMMGYEYGQYQTQKDHVHSPVRMPETLRLDFDGDLGYEDMVGTWVLTEESRRELSQLFVSKFNRDAVPADRRPAINEFTLMMVLSGKHIPLYGVDSLYGSIGAFPRAIDDYKMTRTPYGTANYWREDRTKEKLLDSRVVGHGLDFPTRVVVWALKQPVTLNRTKFPVGRGVDCIGTLVLKMETNPDMWGEYYFDICVEEAGLMLIQELTNDGFSGHIIKWRKIQ